MSSPFDKLFPQDLLSTGKMILKLKHSYDNSIPNLLNDNGYFKQSKYVYFNNFKNIILFYKKGDRKNKRQEVFDELLRVNGHWQNNPNPPQLIYGHLASSAGEEETSIVLYNAVIKIMSGESLLRYLFDNYESILSNIKNEINSNFPTLNTQEAPATMGAAASIVAAIQDIILN